MYNHFLTVYLKKRWNWVRIICWIYGYFYITIYVTIMLQEPWTCQAYKEGSTYTLKIQKHMQRDTMSSRKLFDNVHLKSEHWTFHLTLLKDDYLVWNITKIITCDLKNLSTKDKKNHKTKWKIMKGIWLTSCGVSCHQHMLY